MGPETAKALAEEGAVYFTAASGAGALLATAHREGHRRLETRGVRRAGGDVAASRSKTSPQSSRWIPPAATSTPKSSTPPPPASTTCDGQLRDDERIMMGLWGRKSPRAYGPALRAGPLRRLNAKRPVFAPRSRHHALHQAISPPLCRKRRSRRVEKQGKADRRSQPQAWPSPRRGLATRSNAALRSLSARAEARQRPGRIV